MLPNLLLVVGAILVSSNTSTLKSVVGILMVVVGVLLKIFGGAIADRYAANRPLNCGTGN